MYIRTLAPSMVNETDMVMIMAMDIVTFRHRPTRTSLRTYFRRIGGFLPGPRGPLHKSQVSWRAPFSAVHAACLVTDDASALDLDHPTAHLVHDVRVVGDHHDR